MMACPCGRVQPFCTLGRVIPLIGISTYVAKAAWGAWERPAAVLINSATRVSCLGLKTLFLRQELREVNRGLAWLRRLIAGTAVEKTKANYTDASVVGNTGSGGHVEYV